MIIHHECNVCKPHGVTCKIQMDMHVPAGYLQQCPIYLGDKAAWDRLNPPCETCDSTGIVSKREDPEDEHSYLITVPCPDCDGTGFRKLEE